MSKKIESFIEVFNRSWTKGEFEILAHLLDDDVIFVAPDLETEICGKVQCIQTIIDYSKHAETKIFEVTNQQIHVWNLTAMVALNYYVEYEMNSGFYKENGKEFWTLSHQDESWKLVWRAMVQNKKVD